MGRPGDEVARKIGRVVIMDRLFPNRRACARQVLDTVEWMDDASGCLDGDHDDRPTVAAVLTAESAALDASAPVRACGSERIPPLPLPAPLPAPGSATSAPPAAKANEPEPEPAVAPPEPPPVECAPSGDLALQAVELPSGEVVYRLQPI